MITPRIWEPNFQPNATVEGIAYTFLVILAVIAFCILMNLRKDKNEKQKRTEGNHE